MNYSFYTSPFGLCCLAFSENSLMALTFAETHEDALADLQRRFPKNNFIEDAAQAKLLGDQVFVSKVKGEPPGQRHRFSAIGLESLNGNP